MRVLLVEDELHLARGLAFNLRREGLETDMVVTGEAALEVYDRYDLMVLDVGLPGIDGFEVLRQVRARDERFPVLMLTARAGEEDRVTGLSLGADDYIVKPFSLKELLLRVHGKLRRVRWYGGGHHQGRARLGEATFDFDQHLALRDDQEIKLTAREADLVRYLLDHPGRVVSRVELLVEVWGYTEGTASRTADTFISRLRKMVEPDPTRPRYIVSVRGKGYRYDPEGD